MSNTIKFFVYGTLRVGGAFADRFDGDRVSSTPAKLKGQLFNVSGWFPGIILGGENDVYGELHEYTNVDKVRATFDGIEGYVEGRDGNLYNRKEVEVVTKDGRVEKAFIYEFGDPDRLRKGAERIESGKWEVKGLGEIEDF